MEVEGCFGIGVLNGDGREPSDAPRPVFDGVEEWSWLERAAGGGVISAIV